MSDNFLPLNQSTPVRGRNRQQNYKGNWYQNSQNRHNQNFNRSYRRGNYSQHSNSFGSDYNNSPVQDRNNIEEYLHPSMLQDPWAHLQPKK